MFLKIKLIRESAPLCVVAKRREGLICFADDPIQREFDVISDQYIAQAKPPLKCVNKTVRTQMKATFEAAKKYERKIYY